MSKFIIPAVLLILQCCINFSAGQVKIDHAGIPNAGTVNSKQRGSDGIELGVSFDGNCVSLRFNRMYQKYQITFPLKIDVSTPRSSKTSIKLTIVRLNLIVDDDLVGNNSALKAKVQLLTDAGQAELLLLCDNFERCYNLMQEIDANPDQLRTLLRLEIFGKLGSLRFEFQDVRILGRPKFNCHNGQWEVFQQRLDGNLSFVQSWDDYEKGFGNPNSNYWMGLKLLSAKTVTGTGTSTSRCQLRIETQDFNNKNYWAEYRFFQVFGPEENYMIKFSDAAGSTLPVSSIEYHNNAQFSTFDRDNDQGSVSCSRYLGYGGWWWKNCGQWHLNSAYPYDHTAINQEAYIGVLWPDHRKPMRSSKMMIKCNHY